MSIYYCTRCGISHDADYIGCEMDPDDKTGTQLVCPASLAVDGHDYYIGSVFIFKAAELEKKQ